MLTGQILLQMVIILLIAQLFGYLSQRIGQQWVIGEIVAGLVLGPSLLGLLWPGLWHFVFPANSLTTLQSFGDIGLILYLFSLGSRLDIQLMLQQSRKAILVSASGILLPLALGIALGCFLYPGFAGQKATLFSFVLLIGTSMSITAFPVLARLLTERNLLGTRIGMLALSCASIDDVIARCLLAIIISIISSSSFVLALLPLGAIALHIVAMFFVVRPLLNALVKRTQSKQILLAASFIVLLLSAYITNVIGIHPIFGAFLAGIILPRNVVFTAQIRALDQINALLFLPLYFVYSGLKTQIGLIYGMNLWIICLLILLIACASKILGGVFGVRVTGESWRNALTLGVLMNTRGLIELVFLNIGYDLGVISSTLFTMLVIMALVTTMMTPVLLRPLKATGASSVEETQPAAESALS
jgi:Kef-type K+ transport system membrane component KefB